MLIAPSILAADPLNLERDVRQVMSAGCDWLHVDIMDAHFVPNMSFSPSVVSSLHRAFPDLFLDVHLMMDAPGRYLDAFMDAGASSVTIHAELESNIPSMLRTIRHHGVRAAVALKPSTPVSVLNDYLDQTDMVLVMTVEPGFGGQPFRFDMLDKIRALRGAGYRGLIEADGGLNLRNLPELKLAGLDVAVMGTTIFGSKQLKEDITAMHAL
ncbi:MAG: ribulose-phosphate 3-epimerase [Clostridia bacterium]|nr:ribulose-phosphate 3-epimerase [Clostridia bacterium]